MTRKDFLVAQAINRWAEAEASNTGDQFSGEIAEAIADALAEHSPKRFDRERFMRATWGRID